MSTVSHDPTGPPKPSALYIRHHAHQKLPPEIFCHSESCGQACCSPSLVWQGEAIAVTSLANVIGRIQHHGEGRRQMIPLKLQLKPNLTSPSPTNSGTPCSLILLVVLARVQMDASANMYQSVASRPSRCPHEQYRNNTSQHVRIHRSLHGRSSVTGTVPGRMQGTSICVVSSHHTNQDLSERRHGLTDRVPGLEAIGERCTLRMI